MKFKGFLGYVDKMGFIKYLFQRIGIAFKKSDDHPFKKVYGIDGVLLSDLDDDIPASPLLVIQYKDLVELIAEKELILAQEYTHENLQKLKEEKFKEYHLESTGMSSEEFDMLYKGDNN